MKPLFHSIIALCLISSNLLAQDKSVIPDSLKVINAVKTPSVKNQERSNTCWSFATVSFLESEILRTQNKEYDLSEMFFVYKAYQKKAERYVRFHGKANISPGGQAHDVIASISKFGILPESAYSGKAHQYEVHNHMELDGIVKGFLESLLESKKKTLSPQWKVAFEGILKAYLGVIPEKFEYEGIEYKPVEFAKMLNIKPDDYIELTSFTHHPFNTKFELEVPDNWSGDDYYNVSMDDFMKVIDCALEKGYSIVWDGDVSEQTFKHKKGYATLEIDESDVLTERQKTFDNQSSTDDHLMHLTGVFKDKDGNKYYQIKNSWGNESNDFGGFLYMSEKYLKVKTIAIMVNKNAVPSEIIDSF